MEEKATRKFPFTLNNETYVTKYVKVVFFRVLFLEYYREWDITVSKIGQGHIQLIRSNWLPWLLQSFNLLCRMPDPILQYLQEKVLNDQPLQQFNLFKGLLTKHRRKRVYSVARDFRQRGRRQSHLSPLHLRYEQ